jgi:hypothetical protein
MHILLIWNKFIHTHTHTHTHTHFHKFVRTCSNKDKYGLYPWKFVTLKGLTMKIQCVIANYTQYSIRKNDIYTSNNISIVCFGDSNEKFIWNWTRRWFLMFNLGHLFFFSANSVFLIMSFKHFLLSVLCVCYLKEKFYYTMVKYKWIS